MYLKLTDWRSIGCQKPRKLIETCRSCFILCQAKMNQNIWIYCGQIYLILQCQTSEVHGFSKKSHVIKLIISVTTFLSSWFPWKKSCSVCSKLVEMYLQIFTKNFYDLLSTGKEALQVSFFAWVLLCGACIK